MVRTPHELAAIKRLGARIRARRKAKGWSVLQLASKAEVSFEHVHALERGKHKPRDYTLRRLAKALGVSVEDLTRNGNGNGGRKNGNGNGGARK